MRGKKKKEGPDLQSVGNFTEEPGVDERPSNSNAKEFGEAVPGWKYLLCSYATCRRPA